MATSETVWYYVRKGEPLGPLKLSELQELVESGEITPQTLVFGPGFDEWQKATEVPELAGGQESTPEGNRSKPSDRPAGDRAASRGSEDITGTLPILEPEANAAPASLSPTQAEVGTSEQLETALPPGPIPGTGPDAGPSWLDLDEDDSPESATRRRLWYVVGAAASVVVLIAGYLVDRAGAGALAEGRRLLEQGDWAAAKGALESAGSLSLIPSRQS